MNDPITPSHVANFFLDEAKKEGFPISPMKLIKLVYIGYGWVQAILDEALFEETIEAWKHGPVIRSLYHEFKGFKHRAITTQSMQLDDYEFTEFKKVTHPKISKDKDDILFVLKYAWDVYGRFTASSLRDLTHKDGTPWHKAYKDGFKYQPIDTKDIKEHFAEKIDQYHEVSQVA